MRENWRPYVVTILLLASPLTFGWNHVEAEGADQKEIVLRAGDPSVKINGTEIVLATAPKSIGNNRSGLLEPSWELTFSGCSRRNP
ncbi:MULTISPECIES: hypothetical protein [unclassified Paenibacillus]